MKIIKLQNNKNIDDINAAWDNPESFVIIDSSQKKIPHFLLDNSLDLPRAYQENHFGILTSGSTGQAKLIITPKSRSISLVEQLHVLQNSESINASIVLLPLSYSFAFINQWLWAKNYNRNLVVTPGLSDIKKVIEVLNDIDNAKLCLVGAQVPLLLQYLEGRQFNGINRIHFAGGKFPFSYIKEINKLFPNAIIYNNYGCTEAMPRLSVLPYSKMQKSNDIGNPLPGVEFQLSAQNSLSFKSPYGAVAYVDEQGLTEIKSETWVNTGDIAERKDGSWFILGRNNEVFKRYGEKVAIPNIITFINKEFNINMYYYFTYDSQQERAWCLVLSPSPEETIIKDVLKCIGKNFKRYQWPLRIETVDAVPFLGNGKVDTLKLGTDDVNKTVYWKQMI